MTERTFKKKMSEIKTDKMSILFSNKTSILVDVSSFEEDNYGTASVRTETNSRYTIWYDGVLDVTDSDHAYTNINSYCQFGSDPELFFVRDGEVVPSAMVVPPNEREVKRDGFQGELNPTSNACRETSGSNIARAMQRARGLAQSIGADISLSVGHIISDDVWKNTPLDVKRFGCHPTLNTHEPAFKRVTGIRERFRAAGGHIHIGGLQPKDKTPEAIAKIVAVMDIVAGNTCVLIDRDENNARRRENYGRAGEYRLKEYGLEYRVLSNFWLKHYVLWSMAAGLLRNALGIYQQGLADELIAHFDMTKVRDAINTNNYELALDNFDIYHRFLLDRRIVSSSGIHAGNVTPFLKWAKSKNPMSKLATTIEDTMDSWDEKLHSGADGFESFLGDDDY